MTDRNQLLEDMRSELLRVEGVCWMLIHTLGTHSEEEQPKAGVIWQNFEYMAMALRRVLDNGFEVENGNFTLDVSHAQALATSVENIICADGIMICGSNEVMSALVDAVQDRVRAAIASLDEFHRSLLRPIGERHQTEIADEPVSSPSRRAPSTRPALVAA